MADDKNPAENFGYTPLHFAALNDQLDICKLIIDNVDDKHPINNDGKTPKDLAITNSGPDLEGQRQVSELFDES